MTEGGRRLLQTVLWPPHTHTLSSTNVNKCNLKIQKQAKKCTHQLVFRIEAPLARPLLQLCLLPNQPALLVRRYWGLPFPETPLNHLAFSLCDPCVYLLCQWVESCMVQPSEPVGCHLSSYLVCFSHRNHFLPRIPFISARCVIIEQNLFILTPTNHHLSLIRFMHVGPCIESGSLLPDRYS